MVNEVYVNEAVSQAPSTLFHTCNVDVVMLEVLYCDVGWRVVSHFVSVAEVMLVI